MSTAALEPELRPYLWLRRIAFGTLAVLLALLIARLAVGAIVEARWQAALERLRSAGVALQISELQPRPLDDADNAAWYLKRAMTIVNNVQSPRASSYTSSQLGEWPPYTALWHELADKSEIACRDAFPLIREARNHDQVDWGVKYAPPAFAILLPTLNQARQLANCLADGAERSFINGDSAEGIERIRDCLHLAHLSANRPFLVTTLVAAGIDDLACAALAPHVGKLRIGDAPGEASPAAVRALITELLRDDATDGEQARTVAALRIEATANLDAGEFLAAHARVGRPAVMADAIRVAERQLAIAEVAAVTSNPERDRRFAAIPTPAGWQFGRAANWFAPPAKLGPVAAARPLSHTIALITPNRAIVTTARVAAARDATAIMLAMRLYELDHAGRWPASFDELVPTYLPSVPRNKLSTDDAPYRYILVPQGLPDGRDRPMLINDGVPRKTPPPTPRNPADVGPIVDLTSWTPPSSATQRVK